MNHLLYIITAIFFLLWSILVILKRHLSWHTLISLYVITVFIVDIGDVAFAVFFRLYRLPAHLLNNPDADNYLGIVLSDGMIFPFIAIIFCYYSVKYHRPWLLSILFATLMGIIEFFFVKFGYMVYYHWNQWMTPAITFIMFRVFAQFTKRFVYYSPPVPYWLRLLCFIYNFAGLPETITGRGLMILHQWRPHIFDDYSKDDRLIAKSLETAIGGLAGYLSPKIQQKNKPYLFLGLGIISIIFSLWMYTHGWLLYFHWNHFWTIVRYMTPYLLIYWYDRWESACTHASNCGGPEVLMRRRE